MAGVSPWYYNTYSQAWPQTSYYAPRTTPTSTARPQPRPPIHQATPSPSTSSTVKTSSLTTTAKNTWLQTMPQRLLDGVKRAFRMTFLRPLGWAELIGLHSWGGLLSWVVPAKHFLEGTLHVDSMIIPRLWSPFGNLSQHKQYGRTLWDLLKGKPEKQANT